MAQYPATKPRIIWDPGSGSRNIDFPWPVGIMATRRFGALHAREPQTGVITNYFNYATYASERHPLSRTSPQRPVKLPSRGGVVILSRQNFYDHLIMCVPEYAEDSTTVEAFNDEMTAFWSYAGSGGHFQFLIDPATAVLRVLDFAVAVGASSISTYYPEGIGEPLLDGATPYRLMNLKNGDNEDITLGSAGILPGDYNLGGRVGVTFFAYNVGDALNDKNTYPLMRCVQNMQPVRKIKSGLYTLDLSLAQTIGYSLPGGPPPA